MRETDTRKLAIGVFTVDMASRCAHILMVYRQPSIQRRRGEKPRDVRIDNEKYRSSERQSMQELAQKYPKK
jgi:hypothetical protein